MPLLPWGDYKPDLSDYEGKDTRSILNVFPRGDGYGPIPDLDAFTTALPGACRGGFYALKSDGSSVIFGATSTRLYQLDNSDFSWTDVSNSGSAYSALSAAAQWQFRQAGNLVFATQQNAVLQVFDLTSSTEFEDADGSPPQASYIDVVGRFIVLSGLTSLPYRIQWSGLNDFNSPDSWTAGINSSDFQDFPDGGIVRGVAGGEFGTIFQDQATRRMSYVPGSPLVFQIERISQDKGLYAPYSIIRAGERVFYYAGQGFQMLLPGGYPQPIGRERVDRTFIADLDKNNLQLMIGAADPRGSRVYWIYKSVGGTVTTGETTPPSPPAAGLADKLIGFDFVLDKWFTASIRSEFAVSLSQGGLTLENLDAIYPSIDAMPTSLDNFSASVQPEISMFNSDHKLCLLRGDNLEATLETAEQGTDGNRIFVRGFRPVCDAPGTLGSVSYRETAFDTPTYGTEFVVNSRTGRIDFRRSTRYARFRNRIPAGTDWTFSAGVEPDIVAEGTQ